MKAFLGALVLTLLAAAAGVLAGTELHRLNLAAKLAAPTQQASKLDDATEPANQAAKQRVKYLPQALTHRELVRSEHI